MSKYYNYKEEFERIDYTVDSKWWLFLYAFTIRPEFLSIQGFFMTG